VNGSPAKAIATGQEPRNATQSGSRAWTRTDTNFWLAALMVLVFAGHMGIGVIARYEFPRAANSGGWKLCGYTHDDWLQLQFVTLAFLSLLILLHT